jgi:hypothetical protein
MYARHSKRIQIALGLLSALGITVAFALLFQAGCAGDSKTGALGDPARALELESTSLLPFLVGLIAGASLVARALGSTLTQRTANPLAFVIFGGSLLWLLGVQFEAWGVRSCLAP